MLPFQDYVPLDPQPLAQGHFLAAGDQFHQQDDDSDAMAEQRATAAGKRPKLSLASLIGQAITAQPEQKARLSSIYEWIATNYPEYYKLNQGGWQNSIRHNLTINKAFTRIAKEIGDRPGKGSYWAIHPDHLCEFKDGVFTGKIRSNEYRSAPKAGAARKKRKSAVVAPSIGDAAAAFDSYANYYATSAAAAAAAVNADFHGPLDAGLSFPAATSVGTVHDDVMYQFHPMHNNTANFSATAMAPYQFYPNAPALYDYAAFASITSQPRVSTTANPTTAATHPFTSYGVTLPSVHSVSPNPGESFQLIDPALNNIAPAHNTTSTGISELISATLPSTTAPIPGVDGDLGSAAPPFLYFASSASVVDTEELEMHKMQKNFADAVDASLAAMTASSSSLPMTHANSLVSSCTTMADDDAHVKKASSVAPPPNL